MNDLNELEKVNTFQEGKNYFLKLPRKNVGIPIFTQVTFIGYTSCPAVVIVQDARKEWFRCSREDLFSINLDG